MARQVFFSCRYQLVIFGRLSLDRGSITELSPVLEQVFACVLRAGARVKGISNWIFAWPNFCLKASRTEFQVRNWVGGFLARHYKIGEPRLVVKADCLVPDGLPATGRLGERRPRRCDRESQSLGLSWRACGSRCCSSASCVLRAWCPVAVLHGGDASRSGFHNSKRRNLGKAS